MIPSIVRKLVLLLVLTPALVAEGPSIGPDAALALLKDGQARFLAGTMQHPHQDAQRRMETAKGQAPYAAILACSDSREALDSIFDAGIGDIFTVRVAGNVADTDEIASLEYAAEHLHVPLILVLGHSACGAVTAVVQKAELAGQLPGLLDNIQAPADRAVTTYGAKAPDLVDRAAQENVRQSVHDMLARSAILTELVESRKLKIEAAFYHLDTGAVDWMGPVQGMAAEKYKASPTLLDGPFLGYLAVFFGSLGFLWLILWLFVSEKRVVSSFRIRGRLLFSFVGVVSVVTAGALVSWLTADLIPVFLGLVPALLFAVIYTASHYQGLLQFFQTLKEKWEQSRT